MVLPRRLAAPEDEDEARMMTLTLWREVLGET